MKILLFGKTGQVGWELQRSLSSLGQLTALDLEPGSSRGDLTQFEELTRTIREIQPDIIVNAAAYTAVDNAEKEEALAHAVNATALEVLAREAKLQDAWLVHYSTDYVFDGTGEHPWIENDRTAPLNVYGKTKLEGEEFIRNSGCQHLIFRTSWVYSSRGSNFAKTMLHLARERDRLTVINDQIGAPTGADLIADVTAHALRVVKSRPDLGGTYHLAASGWTSWFGYAELVLNQAKAEGVRFKATGVDPIPTEAFPRPATRPKNSRLDTTKLCSSFDLVLPDWSIGVKRMLTEVLEKA